MKQESKALQVKCPFFKNLQKQKIYCEGVCDDCISTIQTYRNNKDRDKQLDIFCCKHFEKCEIYRAIEEAKY